GGRLVLLDQDGPDRHGPRQVARSGGDEPAASRHGLSDHDQRMAALSARLALLRHAAEEGLVRATGGRYAHERLALRPRGVGYRHDESGSGALVLGDYSRQYSEQGFRRLMDGRDRARPATQRQLLPHRTGHALLQYLPAV